MENGPFCGPFMDDLRIFKAIKHGDFHSYVEMLNHQRVIKLRVKLGWVSFDESRIVMR